MSLQTWKSNVVNVILLVEGEPCQLHPIEQSTRHLPLTVAWTQERRGGLENPSIRKSRETKSLVAAISKNTTARPVFMDPNILLKMAMSQLKGDFTLCFEGHQKIFGLWSLGVYGAWLFWQPWSLVFTWWPGSLPTGIPIRSSILLRINITQSVLLSFLQWLFVLWPKQFQRRLSMKHVKWSMSSYFYLESFWKLSVNLIQIAWKDIWEWHYQPCLNTSLEWHHWWRSWTSKHIPLWIHIS